MQRKPSDAGWKDCFFRNVLSSRLEHAAGSPDDFVVTLSYLAEECGEELVETSDEHKEKDCGTMTSIDHLMSVSLDEHAREHSRQPHISTFSQPSFFPYVGSSQPYGIRGALNTG